MENPHPERTEKTPYTINEIIAMNNKIKAPLLFQYPKNVVNQKTSNTWYDSARHLYRLEKYESAEICYFMAFIYDSSNYMIIKDLIQIFRQNGKYRAAIDFLSLLYKNSDDESIPEFWDVLTHILPKQYLHEILGKSTTDTLDLIIYELDLDESNPMTWLCLGYTLKLHNSTILADQALDNAIALQHIQKSN